MRLLDLKVSKRQINEQLALTIPDLSIRQFLLTNLITDDMNNLKWKCNLEAIEKNLNHILSYSITSDSSFIKPTLFLSGGDSNYIKLTDYQVIRKYFPNVEFISIPGAGHWVHAEKPKIFVDHVVDFIEK